MKHFKALSFLVLSASFVLASCVTERQLPKTSSTQSTTSTPAETSEPATSSTPAEQSQEQSQPAEQSQEQSQPAEQSQEQSEPQGDVFAVKVNDVDVDIANVASGDNKGEFHLNDLEEEDEVTISLSGQALTFYGYNGTEFEVKETTFDVPEDGEYVFYVNAKLEIWVTHVKEVVGLATVDLYVKFAISDAEVNYPTFVWAFGDGIEGAWYVATHVAESWEAENNRHYTFEMENPVGKSVVLAVFEQDCGFNADNLPTSWDKVIKQSSDCEIQNWDRGPGADVTGTK